CSFCCSSSCVFLYTPFWLCTWISSTVFSIFFCSWFHFKFTQISLSLTFPNFTFRTHLHTCSDNFLCVFELHLFRSLFFFFFFTTGFWSHCLFFLYIKEPSSSCSSFLIFC